MVEKRNVRAQETQSNSREQNARDNTSWKPPSLLDAPPARPGMVQRWIATSILGKETPDNVYKRKRAGWEPRPSDTVGTFAVPTLNHGQWAGCIGVEGMILCEMPEEKFKQMKAYYKEKDTEQNMSISSDLRTAERAGGIPIQETRKSSVSRGRDISVMDD
jgi:hypothetical protein|tara:strand:+ start:1808 stop:2290 length:483 start_codon:yes stop_codon:yes gene_type:complete